MISLPRELPTIRRHFKPLCLRRAFAKPSHPRETPELLRTGTNSCEASDDRWKKVDVRKCGEAGGSRKSDFMCYNLPQKLRQIVMSENQETPTSCGSFMAVRSTVKNKNKNQATPRLVLASMANESRSSAKIQQGMEMTRYRAAAWHCTVRRKSKSNDPKGS